MLFFLLRKKVHLINCVRELGYWPYDTIGNVPDEGIVTGSASVAVLLDLQAVEHTIDEFEGCHIWSVEGIEKGGGVE